MLLLIGIKGEGIFFYWPSSVNHFHQQSGNNYKVMTDMLFGGMENKGEDGAVAQSDWDLGSFHQNVFCYRQIPSSPSRIKEYRGKLQKKRTVSYNTVTPK